ncbi:AMP-binding protein [Streptomyces hesseae]|uniref:AMP-binding protein n=1 Tax=Streptomyces hesseae TaxID=3075519 RepID=A0ABU2SLY6_9ACTN|nr:AMP-binding protein [Streptomyces sp. DSM 40473]MDT0449996.1 AMP-binding protein [Streptomyces sp. DSM 40473]
MSPLTAAFDDRARHTPDAPALIWRGTPVPYGELGALAGVFQERLRHLGGDRTAPVCVPARRTPETLALIVAALRDGRPVLLPSAELGADTLRELTAGAGIERVLTAEPGYDAPGGLHVETLTPLADAPAVPEGTGLLLTTSGSTGTPKVVPLPLDAVGRFTDWAAEHFGIGPDTAVLNYAPLNFDLCLLEVWTTLAAGGRVVLVDPDRATDGAHLRELISAHDVHLVQGVPLLYRLLAEDAERTEGPPLKSVRHVVLTGDAVPPRLLARLPELFPDASFANVYGCTETNDSLILDAGPLLARDPETAGPLPVGRPLPGVRVLVLGEDGQPVDGPGTGELLVHTPFQAHGYLDPALGADRFVRRADADGPRVWFRSGDLVRRTDDGTLHLVGRTDFQVKVRGVRLSLEEVEQALLAHPEVADAVVVTVPDEAAGKRLQALVRRTAGSGLHVLALREHCARRLARTAIPSDIRITDAALPKGPTGKNDRAAVGDVRRLKG